MKRLFKKGSVVQGRGKGGLFKLKEWLSSQVNSSRKW